MTAFHTVVDEVPATPLGLLPACWRVWHYCRECRAQVDGAELIAHAKAHASSPSG